MSNWCIKGCKELEDWQLNVMNNKCSQFLKNTDAFYYTNDVNFKDWVGSYTKPLNDKVITFQKFLLIFKTKKHDNSKAIKISGNSIRISTIIRRTRNGIQSRGSKTSIKI